MHQSDVYPPKITMERKNLLNAFITILSVALVREAHIRIFRNTIWRIDIKNWSAEVILKKIKFIISLCGLRTILYMFNRGFFSTSNSVMYIVGENIVRRGLKDLPRVQQLMLQYQAIKGKSYLTFKIMKIFR